MHNLTKFKNSVSGSTKLGLFLATILIGLGFFVSQPRTVRAQTPEPTPTPVDTVDISIVKKIQPSTPSPIYVGAEVTFGIRLTNDGTIPATGVQVMESLPAGLVYVSHYAEEGTYDPVTGIWDVGNISPTQVAGFEIVALIDGTVESPIVNIADTIRYNIDGTDNDIDSIPDNDDGTQSEDDSDSVEVTFLQGGSAGDTVWDDENADGVQDPGENGLEGITVLLIRDDGFLIERQETDSDGNYLFEFLPPGEYAIVIHAPSLPEGYYQTAGIDDLLLNSSGLIVLPGSDYETSVDFGYSNYVEPIAEDEVITEEAQELKEEAAKEELADTGNSVILHLLTGGALLVVALAAIKRPQETTYRQNKELKLG